MYQATAFNGRLTVTGTIEGTMLHLVRKFDDEVQHKFLRADIHASTDDDVRMAVREDINWLQRNMFR